MKTEDSAESMEQVGEAPAEMTQDEMIRLAKEQQKAIDEMVKRPNKKPDDDSLLEAFNSLVEDSRQHLSGLTMKITIMLSLTL